MEEKKLTYNQKLMLKRRGLNPDHYVVVKDLYSSLWLKDVRTGKVKIVNKSN